MIDLAYIIESAEEYKLQMSKAVAELENTRAKRNTKI